MEYVETDGEEYDVQSYTEIEGLQFVLTCCACPEQYDVFKNNKQVGYVRLRWGTIRAEYPDVGGKEVYRAEIGDGAWTGAFPNESERATHLTKIAKELSNAERYGEVQAGY